MKIVFELCVPLRTRVREKGICERLYVVVDMQTRRKAAAGSFSFSSFAFRQPRAQRLKKKELSGTNAKAK